LVLGLPFPASNSVGYTIGLRVGDDTDLLATGPDPFTDWNLDWSLLRQIYPRATGAAVDQNIELEFDVRSMRKMHPLNDHYYLAIHNENVVAETVGLFARTLVALP
jgi:hypothetical protein